MYQQVEKDDFYAAGRKLAEQIADSKGKEVSTATLQALIRDLLPQHEEAQEALRSIVARQDFLQLAKLAGSGKGVAQKCSFTESLRSVYSAKTVEAAERLVCGMMGIGVTTTQNHSEGEIIARDTHYSQSKNRALNTGTWGEEAYERYRQNYYQERAIIKGQKEQGRLESNSVHNSHNPRSLALILVATLIAGGIWLNTQSKAPQVLVNPEIRTSDTNEPQERVNIQKDVPQVLSDPEIRTSDIYKHKERGKKFLVSGNYIAAIKELKLVLESNPNDSDAWGNLGLSYAYLDNRLEAINAYTAGLKSLSDRGLSESPDLLEMRGHSLVEIGEFTSAIEDYTKSIQAILKRDGHQAANSFVYRAEAYTKAGQYGAASRDKATAECLYKLAETANYRYDYQKNLGCIK